MGRKIHGETRRVTVRVPVDLLDDIDEHVERSHYMTRSDYIRDQIRDGIEDDPDFRERTI